jgi:hypothetical protein
MVYSNAWTLEKLLMHDSSIGMYQRRWRYIVPDHFIGSALTFLQLSFVVLYYIPSFLHFRRDVATLKYIPRIESPAVPLKTWGVQVFVLLAVNIFNNWTFLYKIPLTVQIIFRSSGKPRPPRDMCNDSPHNRACSVNVIWLFSSRQAL